ncbi:LysR family transcriptional regulator [Enterovirga rhinocerotis]|uniref:DNA-binding transcriptional LysR family regulator n=1 Tax=Enterovirga rhinocerotis TaxID=1339210 RepID=A0A4R7C4Y7_9HYPH|nr:LysR family transcriptional regulator [Enterovirga rhinocerotis]TDR93231.1 DNA-binding transcriptional LysR family regulator [Enterovirga rhinocerotis]
MSVPLISRVNLKLIQTFLLVADTASFRQAAEITHRSQSAVSTQIRQLEEQLGIALFHRTTRRVWLTSAGEQFLEAGRRALHEVESGLRRIQEEVDIRHGRIALACSPTVASTRLPAVLAAFMADYPSITVHVREITSQPLFESIRRGEVDFGIGPAVASPDFAFEPLVDDPLYAVVPRSMLRGRRATIDLSTLAELPLLLLDNATALRGLLERTMRERGLALTARYQFSQAPTLFAMSAAGLGVAILPEVVLPDAPHPDVRVLRITPTLLRQVSIITLRGQEMSPAAARLAQLCRAMIDPKRAQPRKRPPRREAR